MPTGERRRDDTRIAVLEEKCNGFDKIIGELKNKIFGNGKKGIAYTMEVLVWQVRLNYLLEVAIIGLIIKLIFFKGESVE